MAFSFDGAGDFMVSPAVFNDDDFVSISFWVRVPAGHGNISNDRLFELGGAGTGDGGIGLEMTGTTQYRALIWETTTPHFLGNFSFTLDKWHHVAIVSDASAPDSRFYVDNSEIGNNTTDARVTTQTEFVVAARQLIPANNQTKCEIADLAIWQGHLLTAGERAQLAAGFSPKLVRLPTSGYDLIRDANDYAGGQNLTITNAVPFAHPPIIYPSAPIIGIPVAAVGGVANPWYYYAQQ